MEEERNEDAEEGKRETEKEKEITSKIKENGRKGQQEKARVLIEQTKRKKKDMRDGGENEDRKREIPHEY